MKKPHFSTLAVHGGNHTDTGHNAVFPPIYTASSFIQTGLSHPSDFGYSRVANPTRYAYESALAALEQGTYATATASGMAATALALELLPAGSHIVAMRGVYGGTHRLFEKLRAQNNGLTVDYVDLNDLEAVTAVLTSNTAMIWIETPTNPLLELVDIQAISQFAKQHQLLTCVDNTFATAWNQTPLTLGADIVMLSTSKYIGGHSDMIGGALITADEALAKKIDFAKTTVGAIASPFDAYLALRGLKTLDLRMHRQCDNAQQVAQALEGHPAIEAVFYPGLSSHPQHALCQRQMRSGGAVVTIQLKGTRVESERFLGRLHYFILAESLGGVESMINHSASMSHGSMRADAREAMGVFDTTFRLSVGIEDSRDLIDDLLQALDQEAS
ncbi:PLP-dependent aspartate aminotransferase family protein [Salinivibrio sp. ES.052]|uniref:trans-sulfuration enzyme family protein n=1 Tax=Salinivibrio sp. ES.052 TaxID=1882823 RepID=UPI000928F374|nr:aminotransferase class I/II-fold pyridoxal phosphate-dependent enzyme [Salinivibrio sp. ES.052]SIO35792.1 cystathionine gamma-synthase [Salinivibrio sp. ES.052]